MRREDKLHLRKRLFERANEHDLPRRMKVQVKLIDQHESTHRFRSKFVIGFEGIVTDQISDPGNRRLIPVREAIERQLENSFPSSLCEAVTLRRSPESFSSSVSSDNEAPDAWKKLLRIEQRGLKRPQVSFVFVRRIQEMVGEICAGDRGPRVEESLEAIKAAILETWSVCCVGQHSRNTIRRDEPTRRVSRPSCIERIFFGKCFAWRWYRRPTLQRDRSPRMTALR